MIEELILYQLNYHDQKIQQTPTCDIGNTEQLFQPYWVSSAVHTIISTTRDQISNPDCRNQTSIIYNLILAL